MLDLISYAYYRFCVATLSFIYLFIYLLKELLKVKLKNKLREVHFHGAESFNYRP